MAGLLKHLPPFGVTSSRAFGETGVAAPTHLTPVEFRVKASAFAAAAVSVLLTAGCVHVPPTTVVRDRFDYGQTVAESWKRQMLLNVVRLRYSDAPIFIDVTSIINSYTLAGNASASADLSAKDPNLVTLGATGLFSNTPTVTYQPLTGDRFMKSLLRPIPPASIFQMLQAGWPAELVLRTAVNSVNSLRNQRSGRPADPRFDRLVDLVTRLQQSSGLNIRIEEGTGGEATVFALPRQNLSPSASAESAEVRSLLGIDPNADEYTLTFGLTPRASTEIAVLTRSMLEVMLEYGLGVDLPTRDSAEGRARPGAGGTQVSGLVHISLGSSAPADAYAAIPYRDHWFWIDDRDFESKTRFTFLMILSSLAETGAAPVAPVVTVPAR